MKINLVWLAGILLLLTACGNGNDGNIIEESGTIEATEIILSSKVSGTVSKIHFEEGTLVNTGDTLIEIDHELFAIQLRQAEAAARIAKAKLDLLSSGSRAEDRQSAKEQLKIAEVNFSSTETDFKRFKKLFEEKTITQKQFEEAENRYLIANSNLKKAKANNKKINNIARQEELEQADANYENSLANIDLIKKNIRDCYLIAPIDGFIIKQFIEENETVVPMTSLVKVADLSYVELVIYVSETDLGKIKLGQSAEVFVDSFPEKSYNGNVTFISSEAEFTPKNIQTKDERTKLVFATKLRVDNPDYELKAGMPADAKVYTGQESK